MPLVSEEPPAALRAAVPTGGRRSKPSPRFFSVSRTRFAALSGKGGGLPSEGINGSEPEVRGRRFRGKV